MSKFNLNQLLSGTSLSDEKREKKEEKKVKKLGYKILPISVHDLVPSKDNFYSMEQIQDLKTAIELAGGVKQNLTVTPLDNGKYKVLAGHRRRLASISLVEEGKTEYEFVPCGIEDTEADVELQEIREELLLILTNSQRDKTDWDKVEEVKRLRTVLERYKKKAKLPGRIREIIAEALNTSAAQVGRIDAISNNLSEEFQEEMKSQQIGLSVGYELSGLPEEKQKEAFEEYKQKGGLSIKDVKDKKEELKQEHKEEEKKEEPEQTNTELEKQAEEGPEIKTNQKPEHKDEIPESLPPLPSVYKILKDMDISELAEFICYRCDGTGRFCDLAIECNQSKETERHKICVRWLKNAGTEERVKIWKQQGSSCRKK